jgi:uncharacterized phage protein (TIGR02218 family)
MSYDGKEQSQLGGAPVELYYFQSGSDYWCYTSGDVAVNYAGRDFTPAIITRGDIDESDEDQAGSLEITVLRNNNVAALFIPDLPIHPVTLQVYRFHRGDSETVCFWSGEIASCEFSGSTVKLTGLPVSRAFRRNVPTLTFQSQCNWAVYSSQCGLDKGSYRVTAVITGVSGALLYAAAFATHPDGYFRSGWVETAAGETHFITAHSGTGLTLLTPFRSLQPGDTVYAYPGCDRTLVACAAFGNGVHFCGFPFIPTKNPFVVGIA